MEFNNKQIKEIRNEITSIIKDSKDYKEYCNNVKYITNYNNYISNINKSISDMILFGTEIDNFDIIFPILTDIYKRKTVKDSIFTIQMFCEKNILVLENALNALKNYNPDNKILSIFISKSRKNFLNDIAQTAYDMLHQDSIKEFNNTIKTIQTLNNVDKEFIRKDYNNHKEQYISELQKIISFEFQPPKEFQMILENFINIKNKQLEIKRNSLFPTTEIRHQVDEIRKEDSIKKVNSMSIEEIKNAKAGIRYETLMKSGINTLGDAYKKGVIGLSGIDGIGPLTASKTIEYIDKLYDAFKTDVKFSISVDDKTTAKTKLITTIYNYLYFNDIYKKTKDSANTENYIENLNNIIKSCSSKNWLLLTSQEKQNLHKQYVDAKQTIDADCYKIILSAEPQSPDIAWNHFKENTITYINIIEKAVPNIFGKDDSQQVMPRQIIDRINGLELRLDGLRCQLRSYQFWGAKYIVSQQRSLVGDEMGLGKTIEAITAMVHIRNCGGTHFVVICPSAVVENWRREIIKFSDFNVLIYKSSQSSIIMDKFKSSGGILVASYSQLKDDTFNNFNISMTVVDEAHYIKNSKASRTKRTLSAIEKSQYVTMMTGTALENKVNEMIALIQILNCDVADKLQQVATINKSSQFRKIASAVYFRRTVEQVASELPELTVLKEWVELNDAEREKYEENILNKRYMSARQMSFDVPFNISTKIERIKQIVDQAKADNRKIIIFSFFRNTIQVLQNIFGSDTLMAIDGSISSKMRQQIIDQFTNDNNKSVLLCQVVAGGTGLNIQAASVVIFCEPQYKPSTESQATARSHRMGQTRNVFAYHLLASNTIEERIDSILERKQKEFDEFADKSDSGKQSIEIDANQQKMLFKEEYERIVNNKERFEQYEKEQEKIKEESRNYVTSAVNKDTKTKERGKLSAKLRNEILMRDNCTCQICGRSPKTTEGLELEVDHIIPVDAGGKTIQSNLRTLCKECNVGKSNHIYENDLPDSFVKDMNKRGITNKKDIIDYLNKNKNSNSSKIDNKKYTKFTVKVVKTKKKKSESTEQVFANEIDARKYMESVKVQYNEMLNNLRSQLQNKTAVKNIDDENNFSIFLLTTENTIRNSIKVELIKS